MGILLNNILKKLPPNDETDYRSINNNLFQQLNKTCVVIDDDPTGNQTVYDIPLLTEWDIETIVSEFKKQTPIFFILTNSRSLTAEKSAEIYLEISRNIEIASGVANRNFSIISRSDSTLRGHFPSEIDAIKQGGEFEDFIIAFIPVMFEGGRVTVNNTHFLLENEKLIPVNETPFSQDHSFGYTTANLKEWIEEKSEGKVKASKVSSISIEEVRVIDVISLSLQLCEFPSGNYCIFNALNYQDLDKISNALLLAEKLGKKIVYRTSSSFVPSYIGLKPKPLLNSSEIVTINDNHGGLTIVGSYVSKSSEQLNYALKYYKKDSIFEIEVEKLFHAESSNYLKNITQQIDILLAKGDDTIVFTSRKLITGNSIDENLNIGERVSNALIQLVKDLKVRPKYLIAKGGITSHDLAIKGLGMKRSKVLGQLQPGIPVWEMGAETKFPKLPYIVFPGNVGNHKTLFTIIQKLT